MDKTLDLDELERVAREATQGEWVSFDRDTASNIYSAGNNGSLLAVCHSYTTDVSEKRPNAARRKANATYIATFDPPTILTLIAAARPAGINTPDMPGQFEGDIWFGDSVKRNLGTHRWENGEWVLLPSELESVLELLAVRTAQRDAALSAARPAVVSDEVVERMARGFLEGLNEGRSLEFDALQPGDWAELRSAMRAALALLPGGVPDREAIARVIDPDGWATFDRQRRGLIAAGKDLEVERGPWMYVERSLAKADAIIAMLSASPKGTDVAESAAGDASHLTASETQRKSESVGWPDLLQRLSDAAADPASPLLFGDVDAIAALVGRAQ